VRYLSLAIRALFPSPGVAGAPTCKYHPSCSQYAEDALRKHGFLIGSAKTAWRVLRCNPWSRGGVDYA
jgi:putative membrane protein insertion efficiency factor